MEKSKNKKKYILLGILIVIFTLVVLFYLFINQTGEDKIVGAKFIKENKETVKNEAGIPLENDPSYSKLGFDRIPELSQLQKVVGDDHGSEILSVTYVPLGTVTWAKVGITFVDPKVEGGSFDQVVYYKYENQTKKWEFVVDDTVPKNIKQSL